MSKETLFSKVYLPKVLEKLNENPTVFKEFEIRFEQLTKSSRKHTPIDPSTFFRLKKYLIEKYGTPTETHSEDKIQNGLRQSLIAQPDGSEKLVTIEKKNIWNSKYDDRTTSRPFDLFDQLGLKLSLSTEIDVSQGEFKDPDIIRTKNRFTWKDSMFQFDLTQVTSAEKRKPTETTWEFEIELLHPLFADINRKISLEERTMLQDVMNRLYMQVLTMLKVVNNTDIVYSSKEKKLVDDFLQENLNRGGRNADAFVVRARNVKYEDLIWGGIVGGPVQYTVTPKASGFRAFLVIHGYGVWLVYPGNQYCLIEKAPTDPEKYKEWKWFPFRGTVIDGEDVEPENRKKDKSYSEIKHYYLPFDTLYFAGEDVRNKTLTERQRYCDRIRNAVGSNTTLVLKTKPYLPIGKTSEDFFATMKNIFELTDVLEYETDGVVFTPINSEYNPIDFRVKESDRVLTKTPDICKWKPKDEYTIDLKVKQSVSKRGLYSSKGDEDVEFLGDDWNPFDPEIQVDWYHPMFANIPNNAIVEFGPKINSDGQRVLIDEKVILSPMRIREDKPYANSEKTAISTWKDLNDPILEETLLGKTTRLLRKYHNRVKKNLLNVPGSDNHLIDIGSGQGGDISKMRNFSKILAIEPNEKNMKEFRRRLSQQPDSVRNKFATLVSGGEEYEKILQSVMATFGTSFGLKPLYISMMLSLSFFWKSTEMLQQLANTINVIKEEYYRRVPKELKGKNTVKFLFLTIEGSRTKRMFEEYGESVNLNDALFNLKDDVVYIDFPNTIVENQVEYLVNLSELREITDMKVKYEKDADEEKLLSENEKIFTSMYVYGEYDLPNKSIYIFRKEEEKIEVPEDIEVQEEPENLMNPSEVGLEISSTLFACIFEALREDKSIPIQVEHVLLYRKEISEAITKPNPFDAERRSIFESAGNGFLMKIDPDVDFAKAWIFSDNELTPEYVSWLPDVIGSNLVINGMEYTTTLPSSVTVYLDYEPMLNIYTLK